MESKTPVKIDPNSSSSTSDLDNYDWLVLPTELWINIWSRLPTSSILALTQLNQDFKVLIRSRDTLSIDPPVKLNPKSPSLLPALPSFKALLSKFPLITSLRLCTMTLTVQHIQCLEAPLIDSTDSISELTSSLDSSLELSSGSLSSTSRRFQKTSTGAAAPTLNPLEVAVPWAPQALPAAPNANVASSSAPPIPAIPPHILQDMTVLNANLTALSLEGCLNTIINDKWALAIWFPNVTHLDISGTALSSSACTPANFSPSLTRLNLSSCLKVQGATIETLATFLKKLEHLELRGLYRLNDGHLVRIIRSNPGLTYFDISGLQSPTDTTLLQLQEVCPNLSTLLIKRCNLTHTALARIPQYWRSTLTTLNMGISMAPEESILSILTGLKSIRYLFLQNALLTKDSRILSVIAENCPSIESLDLRDCNDWLITKAGIELLLDRCPKLRSLYLRSPHVKDEHIEALSKNPSSLTALYLQECTGLTTKSIKFFNRMPKLMRLVLTDITFDADIEEEVALCKHILITYTKYPKAESRRKGRQNNTN